MLLSTTLTGLAILLLSVTTLVILSFIVTYKNIDVDSIPTDHIILKTTEACIYGVVVALTFIVMSGILYLVDTVIV
jgi:hypothetical protein